LVHLPAEMAALGKKFALIRNALSMVLCIAISILTVLTYYALPVCQSRAYGQGLLPVTLNF